MCSYDFNIMIIFKIHQSRSLLYMAKIKNFLYGLLTFKQVPIWKGSPEAPRLFTGAEFSLFSGLDSPDSTVTPILSLKISWQLKSFLGLSKKSLAVGLTKICQYQTITKRIDFYEGIDYHTVLLSMNHIHFLPML